MIQSKVGKSIAGLAVAAGLLVGGAGAAFATISYVGGGTWDHGVNNTTIVWSDYYHGSKCHGATSVGTYTDRDSASAGYWAITEAPARLFAVDESYWRTTC